MSTNDSSPAAPEGARSATGGAAGDAAADRGRSSSRRKTEAVLHGRGVVSRLIDIDDIFVVEVLGLNDTESDRQRATIRRRSP